MFKQKESNYYKFIIDCYNQLLLYIIIIYYFAHVLRLETI